MNCRNLASFPLSSVTLQKCFHHWRFCLMPSCKKQGGGRERESISMGRHIWVTEPVSRRQPFPFLTYNLKVIQLDIASNLNIFALSSAKAWTVQQQTRLDSLSKPNEIPMFKTLGTEILLYQCLLRANVHAHTHTMECKHSSELYLPVRQLIHPLKSFVEVFHGSGFEQDSNRSTPDGLNIQHPFLNKESCQLMEEISADCHGLNCILSHTKGPRAKERERACFLCFGMVRTVCITSSFVKKEMSFSRPCLPVATCTIYNYLDQTYIF